jgi:2-polyprenyl-6-hydroxyphenyl methylase/3-demethylubiquinone-9 3-methyltransferase
MSDTASKPRNMSEAEIEKFNRLAERWWDATSEFKPLHDINPLRLDYIDERTPLSGQSVLDIGTGGGILAESMAQRGAKVTGIDLADASLGVATLHARQSGLDIEYLRIDAESYAEENPARFDIVTCLETLEHVPDPASMVAACAKLVKPGGSVYFSTINRNPKAWLFAIVGAEYVLRLLPVGTHEYRMLIKPSELAYWCRQEQLDLKESIGLHYNPVTQRYWLAPGLDVNYMMHTTR